MTKYFSWSCGHRNRRESRDFIACADGRTAAHFFEESIIIPKIRCATEVVAPERQSFDIKTLQFLPHL